MGALRCRSWYFGSVVLVFQARTTLGRGQPPPPSHPELEAQVPPPLHRAGSEHVSLWGGGERHDWQGWAPGRAPVGLSPDGCTVGAAGATLRLPDCAVRFGTERVVVGDGGVDPSRGGA